MYSQRTISWQCETRIRRRCSTVSDTASEGPKTRLMVLSAALLVPCGLFVVVVWSVIKSVFFSPLSAALWPRCQCRSVSLTSRRHSASQHAVRDVGGGVSVCVCVCVCVRVFIQLEDSHADINYCILLHHSAQGLSILSAKIMKWTYSFTLGH